MRGAMNRYENCTHELNVRHSIAHLYTSGNEVMFTMCMRQIGMRIMHYGMHLAPHISYFRRCATNDFYFSHTILSIFMGFHLINSIQNEDVIFVRVGFLETENEKNEASFDISQFEYNFQRWRQ